MNEHKRKSNERNQSNECNQAAGSTNNPRQAQVKAKRAWPGARAERERVNESKRTWMRAGECKWRWGSNGGSSSNYNTSSSSNSTRVREGAHERGGQHQRVQTRDWREQEQVCPNESGPAWASANKRASATVELRAQWERGQGAATVQQLQQRVPPPLFILILIFSLSEYEQQLSHSIPPSPYSFLNIAI